MTSVNRAALEARTMAEHVALEESRERAAAAAAARMARRAERLGLAARIGAS